MLAASWISRVTLTDAARGRLLRSETVVHAYPHCWRCGTPLLYYAKPSWYIRTSALRDRLLAANETVNWHPAAHQARPLRQVAGEQRRLGDLARALLGHAAARLALRERPRRGVGSFAEVAGALRQPLPDPHRPFVDEHTWPCAECGAEMRRVPEVIDVWFDSGAMPFAQRHAPFENEERFRETFPADYICEAIDQTRGWFYSLIAISTLLFDRAPYRTVLCLGHIADPQGKKMSKSLGNIVVPWEVIQRHGADAFRWYYLTSKQPWDGYLFSTETVGESVRQFLLQLWNTYGFYVLYANANEITEPGEPETELDRWAISRLNGDGRRGPRPDGGLRRDARRPGDRGVRRRALELVRPALPPALLGRRPGRVRDAQDCLVEVTKLLAPFTPFVADAIYENLDGSLPSVHLADFPEAGPRDLGLETAMAVARETVRLGLAARGHGKLKVRQPLRAAVVVAAGDERAAIERMQRRRARRAQRQGAALRLGGRRARLLRGQAELPRARPALRQADAAGRGGGRRARPRARAGALRDGGQVGISVDGHDHELGPDDLTLAMQPLEGYQLEREGSHAVALELELDDELRREGLAREIVHAVQNARKGAGLQVEDRIELALGGDAGAARRRPRPRGLPRAGDARDERRPTTRQSGRRRPSRAARCSVCASAARERRPATATATARYGLGSGPSRCARAVGGARGVRLRTTGLSPPTTASAGSISASRRFLGIAPWMRLATWPLRKSSSVGIAMIWYSDAVWMFSSVLSLTTLSSGRSPAISSTIGATMRHGPHHGAQKSTRTG